MTDHKQAHLQLHFDINKTILISDRAAGKSEEGMMNSLLSECIWGRANKDAKGEHVWEPYNLTQRPTLVRQTGCISYAEFVEQVRFPPTGDREFNEKQRKTSSETKRHFTLAGQPGASWAADVAELMRDLAVPPTKESFYKNGRVFVLPAFFNLLRYLLDNKLSFSLTFRTFGTDMPDVIEDFNLFCTGRHPCFLGYHADGSEGSRDLRIEATNVGTFLRDEEHVNLVLGSIEQPKVVEASFLEGKAALSGYAEIWKFLSARNQKVYGLRDFFPFWRHSQESDSSGKLLLVDPADDTVHPIFLDDNVERDRAHIVDVRNLKGEPIPFSETVDKYIVKSEPLLAIRDPQYFVKLVELCRRNRAATGTRESSLSFTSKA